MGNKRAFGGDDKNAFIENVCFNVPVPGPSNRGLSGLEGLSDGVLPLTGDSSSSMGVQPSITSSVMFNARTSGKEVLNGVRAVGVRTDSTTEDVPDNTGMPLV